MSLPVIAVVACLVLTHLVLRSSSPPSTHDRWRRKVLKAVAAVRIMASAALAAMLLIPIAQHAAAWPASARWAAWLAASAGLLFWFANAAAGLWILSPFVGADWGVTVVAAGRRGRVRAYGVTRLELSTSAGWSAQVPYWLVALRPLRTSPRGGPCWVELRLRHDDWSESDLRLVRQVAIFSPYRDITSAVSVRRQSQVVTVRLGLTSRSPASRVQRQLEQALTELRAQPKRTTPP